MRLERKSLRGRARPPGQDARRCPAAVLVGPCRPRRPADHDKVVDETVGSALRGAAKKTFARALVPSPPSAAARCSSARFSPEPAPSPASATRATRRESAYAAGASRCDRAPADRRPPRAARARRQSAPRPLRREGASRRRCCMRRRCRETPDERPKDAHAACGRRGRRKAPQIGPAGNVQRFQHPPACARRPSQWAPAAWRTRPRWRPA